VGTEEAREFLRTHGGSVEYFDTYLGHQRVGQAFFNSLSSRHQELLRGGFCDPFYQDELIGAAIEYLTLQDVREEAAQRKAANNND
jgi:hypothetical protein